MTKECLWGYLSKFCKIYPKHPALETWDLYLRVLSETTDLDGSAALERCLSELTYFPMPAEILKRTAPKETFLSTAVRYKDKPLSEQEKASFDREMQRVAQRLGIGKAAKELQ